MIITFLTNQSKAFIWKSFLKSYLIKIKSHYQANHLFLKGSVLSIQNFAICWDFFASLVIFFKNLFFLPKITFKLNLNNIYQHAELYKLKMQWAIAQPWNRSNMCETILPTGIPTMLLQVLDKAAP